MYKGSSIKSYVFFYLHKLQIEANPPTHPSICITDRKKYVHIWTLPSGLAPNPPSHFTNYTLKVLLWIPKENKKWHKAKREANGHFIGVHIFLYFLFSESIFCNPNYLQFMQIEKNVRFNGLTLNSWLLHLKPAVSIICT